jgi:hypothetical protein
MNQIAAIGNSKKGSATVPGRRKVSKKKKLRPLKKSKSALDPAHDKLPVHELLLKTKSLSLNKLDSENSLLVPHLRIPDDGYDTYNEHDSVASPGRNSLMASQRSWGSNSMDGSEFTASSSRLTTKELVRQITERAQNNQAAPSYVTPIDELLPMQLSWNKVLPANFNKMKPQVNIIGCLQPLELIIAQADTRTRHRQDTIRAKQVICDEKVRQIDEAIQLKYTRAERYALLLAQKQRQAQWLKIIKANLYIKAVWDSIKFHINVQSKFARTIKAAITIRKACKRFMRRHLLVKFQFKFLILFKRREHVFRLALRISRKRSAVHKIKTFLTEYKNHHRVRNSCLSIDLSICLFFLYISCTLSSCVLFFLSVSICLVFWCEPISVQMNVVVHKYLSGVRKVQQNIRDFIACKHGKIHSLSLLWTQLEHVYVRQMIEKRKEQKRNTGKLQSEDGEFAGMDRKTVIEMKNQAKLWSRIDTKMEERIKVLKSTGVIVNESEELSLSRYLLTPRKRWNAINDMLQNLVRLVLLATRFVCTQLFFSSKYSVDCFYAPNLALLCQSDENIPARTGALHLFVCVLLSSEKSFTRRSVQLFVKKWIRSLRSLRPMLLIYCVAEMQTFLA